MVLVYVLAGVIFGGIAALIAARKGRNQALWFFACFLLAGLPLLLLVVLPNEKAKAAEHLKKTTKACPMCAERVRKPAVVCRFCWHEFEAETGSREGVSGD